MKNNILSVGVFILTLGMSLFMKPTNVNAQELDAQVVVQAANLQMVDPKVFTTLENDIREFINGRKWTDDNFKLEEKVKCNFQLTITEEKSATSFAAQLTVQSSRPVFNSAYETILFNHQDKQVEFEYVEFQPIDFNENTHMSELGSILGYYAYIILGYDYDSFAKSGGDAHYLKAQTVVNNAQNSRVKGWKALEDNRRQNRYWLVEDLLSNKHKPLREAYYKYHRLGLDMMDDNTSTGRSGIWSAIQLAKATNNSARNSMAIDVFINTKKSEIIDLFADASVTSPEKVRVMNAMSNIDPANIQDYQKINNTLGGGKGGSTRGNNNNPFSGTPSDRGGVFDLNDMNKSGGRK